MAFVASSELRDPLETTSLLKVSQRSWVEKAFLKRECCKFIASQRDPTRCCCGRLASWHGASLVSTGERWHPFKHTEAKATDAYGTIEFQGAPHPSKAQYVRLSSFDTKPEHVLHLLQKHWGLDLPKLLITVHGGILNFELQPKLKRVFRKGLLKAAKTTGAWIITGGTNTGVTRHVGDAISDRTTKTKNKVVAIGIAPWGVVETKEELIGRDVVVPYHCVSSPRTNTAVLNSNHSYFLLVDNGSVGKYGGEILFRKKLEKHISQQKICNRSGFKARGVPIICVVLEGGTNTIRSVLEYVTDTPPVPVVVCDGSGRAADLLAFTHKFTLDDGTMPESLRDQLIMTVQKTFQYSTEQAEKLFIELMLCAKKKELITVFRMGDGAQDIDLAILTALLKGTNAMAPDQLSLALTWDRVDIARSHIFVYGQEWPEGSLEQAMMDALINDRVDFVRLLLENGVSMQTFLTIPRLEELYNTHQGPINTLRYLMRDVKKHVPSHYRYTLPDIGLVVQHLMGGAFRSNYCRKRFRQKYNAIKQNGNSLGNFVTAIPSLVNTKQAEDLFPYPFHDLMVWSVLMKRQKMAKFMWQHGEEAMAKALLACKLYKAMAHEADQDDLEVDISDKLRLYAAEFQTLALELLEHCFKIDDDYTQQLLTYELKNFSDQTSLGLAVAANHREFIAHTCCQILLTDMWMGGLRMRKSTSLKVLLGILIPPYILALEFKSREELQLMPQTMEEHMDEMEDEDSHANVSLSSVYEDPHNSDRHHVPLRSHSTVSSFCSPCTSCSPLRTSKLQSNMRHSSLSISSSLCSYRNDFGDDMESSFHSSLHLGLKENGSIVTDYGMFNGRTYKKKKSPLRLGKKIYEFYNAPITKFWAHTMAYIIFLACYTFIVLVKTIPNPRWQEYYVMAYIFTMAIEKLRQIIASEPVKICMKLRVFFGELWNIWDTVAITFFSIGVGLRYHSSTLKASRLVYVVDIVFWFIRILEILSVNKYLGPYVKIIGKLVVDMAYFIIILLIMVMSFGVVRQAIHFQNEEPSWFLIRNLFFYPYWMIYGELFADEIDACDSEETCTYGAWVAPALMCGYLLIANVLMINLLIARFNATFIRNNAHSRQIWKFQRYQLILEYEVRPILPPPLIIISHLYLAGKYIKHRCLGKRDYFDNGLKLFLSHEDTEKLHDFEEECVEDYFRDRDHKFQSSSDERVRIINERVENLTMKMEDVNQKENSIKLSLQTVDYRMSKLEDVVVQTADTLTLVQHWMSLQYSRRPSIVEGAALHHAVSQESLMSHKDLATFDDAPPDRMPTTVEEHEEPSETPTRSESGGGGESLTITPNTTMRSIPSPVLVHSKRPVKAHHLRRFTDYSRPYHQFSRQQLQRSISLKVRAGDQTRLRMSDPGRSFDVDPDGFLKGPQTAPVKIPVSQQRRRRFSGMLAFNVPETMESDEAGTENRRPEISSADVVTKHQSTLKSCDGDTVYSMAYGSSNTTNTSSSMANGYQTASQVADGGNEDGIPSVSPPAYPGTSTNEFFPLEDKRLPTCVVTQMTPILTPLRAEYSSITDDIDTSCMIDHSPHGSPTSMGAFFPDNFSDYDGKAGELEAVRTEELYLKKVEEQEHRRMATVIRHRLRQISLDETDSISDIARHVVKEMELKEVSDQLEDEDFQDVDSSNSQDSDSPLSEQIQIRISQPTPDNPGNAITGPI